ncbi:MAG: hypothetical protein QOH56_4055 [Pseudonocardiales bacterium]|nr:hypothetical protein [Pseudonocardiales bacterium]
MPNFDPVSPERLAQQLADLAVARHPVVHPLRVALDAPRCAAIGPLVTALGQTLTLAGRVVGIVHTETFYRDASLRLEYGKTDVESFYSGWLDVAALQREVLRPVGPSGPTAEPWSYLPSLRDPVTNRATRVAPATLPSAGVLIVTGELLFGHGLPFDLTVHAWVSRQARGRRTDPDWAWALPAFDRYDLDVNPVSLADVVLRYDDPAHPAIAVR